MRAEIKALTAEPKVFQQSKCSSCHNPLELPTINFLCMHSFHQVHPHPMHAAHSREAHGQRTCIARPTHMHCTADSKLIGDGKLMSHQRDASPGDTSSATLMLAPRPRRLSC